MKSGKAPGLDGFTVECLKKGGIAVLEWLVRLLNVCVDVGIVPIDWRGACIVPLYKRKGDKYECSNSVINLEMRKGILNLLQKKNSNLPFLFGK